MKRADKAVRIMGILNELHPETPIPLDHKSPFQLLVAVLMSAQTTDKKVNQVTPELFRRGPDAHSMAILDAEEIHEFETVITSSPLTNLLSPNFSEVKADMANRFADDPEFVSNVFRKPR